MAPRRAPELQHDKIEQYTTAQPMEEDDPIDQYTQPSQSSDAVLPAARALAEMTRGVEPDSVEGRLVKQRRRLYDEQTAQVAVEVLGPRTDGPGPTPNEILQCRQQPALRDLAASPGRRSLQRVRRLSSASLFISRRFTGFPVMSMSLPQLVRLGASNVPMLPPGNHPYAAFAPDRCSVGDFLRRCALPRPGSELPDHSLDFDTVRLVRRFSGVSQQQARPRGTSLVLGSPQQFLRSTDDLDLLDGVAHDYSKLVGAPPHQRGGPLRQTTRLVLVFHRYTSSLRQLQLHHLDLHVYAIDRGRHHRLCLGHVAAEQADLLRGTPRHGPVLRGRAPNYVLRRKR